ncbi:TetR/AcrR family transcriptional regulator [Bradyrhizobium sp. UFLA05-109]
MRLGRPRTFDVKAALDAAVEVFWRHGYEGSSIGMLIEAMGIGVPSLYAAFGNKDELFRKAVERYDEKYGELFRAALEEPTARRVFASLIRAAIIQATRPRRPDGCLLVQGALASGPDADSARTVLMQYRHGAETAIRERFERAAREGDLPPAFDPTQLARFVWTVNQGVAVQAAGGATRPELESVWEMATRCWPSEGSPDDVLVEEGD